MSISSSASAPGVLRSESLNITLSFTRTGPTTGRISWNIPSPSAGCTADSRAYNGIVLALGNTPATIGEVPKAGHTYEGDADLTSTTFAGDTIGDHRVVGALYADLTTTSVDLTGLATSQSYYVVGYPVDAQLNYFKEGVHAYSLPFTLGGTDDSSGTQVVVLNPDGNQMGSLGTDSTGLTASTDYTFSVELGVVPKPQRPLSVNDCKRTNQSFELTINGTNAQTVTQLVNAINVAWLQHEDGISGNAAPNTGALVANSTGVSTWNGSSATPATNVIVHPTDPSLVTGGMAWYNPTTNALNLRDTLNTAWVPTPFGIWTSDPTTPTFNQIWFDGSDAHIWNGTTWCTATIITSTTNPSIGAVPAPGTYWVNTLTGTVKVWNADTHMWTLSDTIEYPTDPTIAPSGTLWFNTSTLELFTLNGIGIWGLAPNVSVADNAPTTPAIGKLWVVPSTQVVSLWDGSNWVPQQAIVHTVNPLVRHSCDSWWNTSTNTVSVWNITQNTWVASSNVFVQSTDPTALPQISDHTVWVNPTTGNISTWYNSCFSVADVIETTFDPTLMPTNTIWKDQAVFKQWNGSTWNILSVLHSVVDPLSIPINFLWWNGTNSLSSWNGVNWVSVTFLATNPTPAIGYQWINTLLNTLNVWNGSMWTVTQPRLLVEHDCNRNIKFTDTTRGSLSFVKVIDGDLFSSLAITNTLHDPNPGTDGASSHPTYSELGVGTDGSDAFRLKLANEIRYELGYPIVDVELAPEQLDFAISRALQEFRARSSAAYRRGFFFMAVTPEHQRFLLTNKVSGMHKIVDVMGVYRVTSAFLSSAHGAGVYGQIVLQHMYQMGSFDLLSYHLMAEYTKLLEMLFAARITFNWNEQTRELFLHHRFPVHERTVCIEATIERTEQEILADRYSGSWIHKYATAMSRLILSESRGKFSSLPGASGSISMNASELRQSAQEDIKECIVELENYAFDRPEEYGMGSTFIFG